MNLLNWVPFIYTTIQKLFSKCFLIQFKEIYFSMKLCFQSPNQSWSQDFSEFFGMERIKFTKGYFRPCKINLPYKCFSTLTEHIPFTWHEIVLLLGHDVPSVCALSTSIIDNRSITLNLPLCYRFRAKSMPLT